MPDYFERRVGLQSYLPASGQVFIDIGANEGSWTLPFAKTYHVVHSFEPDARPRIKLCENLAKDKVSNVRVHEQALGNYTGKLSLNCFETSVHTSAFCSKLAPNDKGRNVECINIVEVDCTTFDKFAHQQALTPDALLSVKIDVEGAELIVLQGAIDSLEKLKLHLFIEIHSNNLKRECTELLTALGYKVDVVRHPAYTPVDANYDSHLWLNVYRG